MRSAAVHRITGSGFIGRELYHYHLIFQAPEIRCKMDFDRYQAAWIC